MIVIIWTCQRTSDEPTPCHTLLAHPIITLFMHVSSSCILISAPWHLEIAARHENELVASIQKAAFWAWLMAILVVVHHWDKPHKRSHSWPVHHILHKAAVVVHQMILSLQHTLHHQRRSCFRHWLDRPCPTMSTRKRKKWVIYPSALPKVVTKEM